MKLNARQVGTDTRVRYRKQGIPAGLKQCEAFLNAYGMSRFAPLDYEPCDLPIH